MKQIFIHGLGQSPESWDRTIRKLAVQDSICPDLTEIVRGKDVTYSNLYAAFSDLCGRVDGKLDLCGLSLGGVLALHDAAEHPDRVNSLVLIAAQYKMPRALLRFQNLIFRWMPEAKFVQTGFGKADFLRLCSSMMDMDFRESLSKIDCPVLVICGERDRANRSASRQLAKLLKNAELTIMRGIGHEVNVEAPERLAEILGRFYDRVD